MTHDKLLEQTGITAEAIQDPEKENSKLPIIINFNPVKKINE
jgi:hypothetical protein